MYSSLFTPELCWSDSKIWTETLFPLFFEKLIKCSLQLIKLVSFQIHSLQAKSLSLSYRTSIPRHSKRMNQNVKILTFRNTVKPWIFSLPGFSWAWKCHVFVLFFITTRDKCFIDLRTYFQWNCAALGVEVSLSSPGRHKRNSGEYEIIQDL